MVIFTRRPIST